MRIVNFKRAGLYILFALLSLAACTPPQDAPPTATPAPPATDAGAETMVPVTATPRPTYTPRPPTATPYGRVLLTALRDLAVYDGPGAAYRASGAALPADAEAVVVGRDPAGDWAQIDYPAGRGWVAVSEDGAVVAGDLQGLPIIPVPPVTETPPPPTETFTPAPTLTPPPTFTRAPTLTAAPTPEDRDSAMLPGRQLGMLAGDFDVSGEGALALLNDTYDYISWYFDSSMHGTVSIELTFTCSDPNAEMVASLYSTRHAEPLARLYPVCGEGPQVVSGLEPSGLYQLELWLRDERPGVVDVTLEPDLATSYTFRLRRR
ncbi:MAG: hypothetical protein JXB47_16490 [Anaerolineae bacterium]|nr:hypothetical protein [Anaerolineae bacterium]